VEKSTFLRRPLYFMLVPGSRSVTLVDAEVIARYAEALHHFLTARALAAWTPRAGERASLADPGLELQVRTVLAELDRLRHEHRREPIGADRWLAMRAELQRAYRAMTDATH
jgi:hypothetical protein